MGQHYAAFYAIIKQIPYGSVLSYGEVAALAGLPQHARHVGYALAALKVKHAQNIPWHRVVNANGTISHRAHSESEDLQRLLLENEGVIFDARGKIINSKT